MTPPADTNQRHAARTTRRREIFDKTWQLVQQKHFDKTLGGLNWKAIGDKYRPLALGAPNDEAFYRFANEMLGELGQSHLKLIGPGLDDTEGPAKGGPAHPGMTVRIVGDDPVITFVAPGSPAQRAGLKPGFVVTEIGGWKVTSSFGDARPLRPVEKKFEARVQFARRLHGPPGTPVTINFLDGDNQPGQVVVQRALPDEDPVVFGHLPPLYPELRVRQVGKIGIIRFNFFVTKDLLPGVQAAIDRFRRNGARAIIFDLRGNPGGQGAVAIPIAARLTKSPITLGTLQFRDFGQSFTATPSIGVKPFLGKVVVVTDEGTASTAEIFAAGLQEAGRAVVVGQTTVGAVLPSQIESLPGGALLQYVVADFRTPKGILLEGRGVQPDRRVAESRAAYLSGRDPVMEVALSEARSSRKR